MSLDEKKNIQYSDAKGIVENQYPEREVKQSIKELGEKCKAKWDKGNFVLANIQEFIIEVFGKGLI